MCLESKKKININFVKKNVPFYCVKLVVLDKLLKWKSSTYFQQPYMYFGQLNQLLAY